MRSFVLVALQVNSRPSAESETSPHREFFTLSSGRRHTNAIRWESAGAASPVFGGEQTGGGKSSGSVEQGAYNGVLCGPLFDEASPSRMTQGDLDPRWCDCLPNTLRGLP